MKRQSTKERFWSKVNRGKPDECWEWNRYAIALGYAKFWVDGKLVRAHRYAWELTNGSIPKDMQVLHRCDNKLCMNPDHLYLGTHCNNMTDAMDRKLMGTGSGWVKLYEGEIWLIRKLKIPISGCVHQRYKFSARMVAKMFKVSPTTILRIWNSDKHLCKENCYI